MTQSFENFDKPYRRGLVLGLSLAELFLILLFLLLLAAIGITSMLNQELNKSIEKEELASKSSAEFQDQLKAIYDAVGTEIKPEDFTQLVKAAGEKKALERELDKLSQLLEENENALEQLQNLSQVVQSNGLQPEDIEALIEDNKELSEVLSEWRSRSYGLCSWSWRWKEIYVLLNS